VTGTKSHARSSDVTESRHTLDLHRTLEFSCITPFGVTLFSHARPFGATKSCHTLHLHRTPGLSHAITSGVTQSMQRILHDSVYATDFVNV
jgi:hypothetical protein